MYLFLIFLNFMFAIVFSWLSKVLVVYATIVDNTSIEYAYDRTVPIPNTLASWFILRILDFRISFLFVVVSTYFSYILKVKVFEKGYRQIERIFVIAFGIFTFFFSLIVYDRDVAILDVFAFLFVLIYVSAVYIPFLIKAFSFYRKVEETKFQTAFLALSIMSLSILLVFLNLLFDRLVILITGVGFTIFYFLSWTCGIIAILGAYFGYIRPKS